MNDRNAALGHHFGYVTVAELVGDVPTDRLDDEQTVKVATFEENWQVRGKLGHAADYLTLQRLHQSLSNYRELVATPTINVDPAIKSNSSFS